MAPCAGACDRRNGVPEEMALLAGEFCWNADVKREARDCINSCNSVVYPMVAQHSASEEEYELKMIKRCSHLTAHPDQGARAHWNLSLRSGVELAVKKQVKTRAGNWLGVLSITNGGT